MEPFDCIPTPEAATAIGELVTGQSRARAALVIWNVVRERDHLRAQRDDLQATCTALLERARAAEARLRALHRTE